MDGAMRCEEQSFDVVVIGGGGAGALAAIECKRAGKKVALVSKESSLVGGATIMSAGGTSAAFDPNDNPDAFFADIMKAGKQLNNQKLARIVAEGSVAALTNLESYNFILDRKDAHTLRTVKQGEGHAFPRGYLDRREALGFSHALCKALMRSDIALFPETVVSKLFVCKNRIAGLFGVSIVSGEYIVLRAKAVILATGGLGALYKVTTNSDLLTGDGYALAWDSGAELIDMEMVQFLPLAFPYPEARRGKIIGMCSHFGNGVKLYNALGERYMSKYDADRMEFTTRDIAARANFLEIKEGRGTDNHAILVDPRDHDPSILQRFKTSVPHIYAMFKEVYGARAADWLEPFEAIPSQHFFMGGIRIDEQCRTSIAGLFAVGEVAGGLHGANRLSGVALTEIFVFGPRAGRAAAIFTDTEDTTPLEPSEVNSEIERLESLLRSGEGIRPFELKTAIQNIMWDELGPVRHGSQIQAAITSLEDIRKNLKNMAIGSDSRMYNRDKLEAIEVTFMIRTALLVAHSALQRCESRGSHYRMDFPETDKKWLKNIILTKVNEEDISIRTEKPRGISGDESKM